MVSSNSNMHQDLEIETKGKDRSYRHFVYPPVKKASEKIADLKEFFYIGSDFRQIDFLMRVFPNGYAPESQEKAFSLLEKLPRLNSVPDVIVFDAKLGEAAITRLYFYLSSRSHFASVPLIVEASSLTVIELQQFRQLGFIDEIVFLDTEDPAHFERKLDFLIRMKAGSVSRGMAADMPFPTSNHRDAKAIAKRIFDVTISLVAIIILLPVFLLLCLLIKLESPGPVVYVSKRAGRGFRIFNFFKFRTMNHDADKNLEELSHLNVYNTNASGMPIFFKGSNDPRVTRLGIFLRKTSLDELPQLFNVLTGDMSLVGNRPLPLVEAVSLTTDEWAARFLAPAGMTGLWQIKKKHQKSMSVEERISLDIAYANNYNFLYDLWIMANTPSALIQRSNS